MVISQMLKFGPEKCLAIVELFDLPVKARELIINLPLDLLVYIAI